MDNVQIPKLKARYSYLGPMFAKARGPWPFRVIDALDEAGLEGEERRNADKALTEFYLARNSSKNAKLAEFVAVWAAANPPAVGWVAVRYLTGAAKGYRSRPFSYRYYKVRDGSASKRGYKAAPGGNVLSIINIVPIQVAASDEPEVEVQGADHE